MIVSPDVHYDKIFHVLRWITNERSDFLRRHRFWRWIYERIRVPPLFKNRGRYLLLGTLWLASQNSIWCYVAWGSQRSLKKEALPTNLSTSKEDIVSVAGCPSDFGSCNGPVQHALSPFVTLEKEISVDERYMSHMGRQKWLALANETSFSQKVLIFLPRDSTRYTVYVHNWVFL